MKNKDFDVEKAVFKEPLVIFYTDDKGVKSRIIPTLEDLIQLKKECAENGWEPGVGPNTIDFQIWIPLARKFLLRNE